MPPLRPTTPRPFTAACLRSVAGRDFFRSAGDGLLAADRATKRSGGDTGRLRGALRPGCRPRACECGRTLRQRLGADAIPRQCDGLSGDGQSLTGTWSPISGGMLLGPHDDQRTLAFMGDGTLLDTCDGGIFRLTDPQSPFCPFDFWASINGNIQSVEFQQVAYDSVNGVIFGGNQDNSVPVQMPGSLQWTGVPGTGGDGGDVAVDNSGSQPLYYTESNQRFKSYRYQRISVGTSPRHSDRVATFDRAVGARYSGLNPLDYVTMAGIPATAISNPSDTSPITVTTSSTGILVKGATVVIKGVAGNTAANQTWTVSNVTATSFTLDGSSGNQAYAGGGTWEVDANGGDGFFPIVTNSFATSSPEPILIGGGPLTGIYESIDQGRRDTDVASLSASAAEYRVSLTDRSWALPTSAPIRASCSDAISMATAFSR